MKNLKQVAFGLLVGAMAISFSAFTTAPKTKAKFAIFYYGLNQAGTTYTRESADPVDDCNSKPANPSCVISYTSDQGASLSASSLPSGSTPEGGNGWVNP